MLLGRDTQPAATKRASVQTEPRSMQNLYSVMANVWRFMLFTGSSTRKGFLPFFFLGFQYDNVIRKG